MTTTENAVTFKIVHSHGLTETGIVDYDEAVSRVRSVYGEDVEVGHSGDIDDGGEKTLCWTRDMVDSYPGVDASRACCSIRKSWAVSR